ncbi:MULTISPECIES: CPBP family intramembrane glutamic endopeptidase [Flavobacteriaceae]|uniref:CPBP family intramembrane glutamic endopeptidase n=1 Tax=Flavobacteriaceae TaxID=49546 RepID=UPI001491E417|nr:MULTISPECIES: CPBP family intramembrane glutamic endopeptidase [Allomuricauda]MDC6364748.1 CPBP family intramembrane metalloprotease [Muricauda sp. AC10]
MAQNMIKPIKLPYSFLIFGTAALLFLFIERSLLPYLGGIGVNKLFLFLIMAVPHIIFFSVALIGYRLEGNAWKWTDFRTRFRFKSIKGKMWLWAVVFVLVDIGLYLAVYKLAHPFVKSVHDAFPPPEILHEIMGDGKTFIGYTTKGNWWLLFLHLFFYFFNVLGEEFLWRGYLFPKQELRHGKYTWVVHGLLWTMFHLFAPYNALMVLPGALFMSYVVQRTQNNTIFLISHAVLNGIPVIGLIINIIG